MNTKLLLKIKEQILREPKQFVMIDVFLTWNASNIYEEKYSIPNCGTAACIAGWAVCLTNNQNPREAKETIGGIATMDKAQVLLRIDEKGGDRLFLETEWPSLYRFDWEHAQTAQEKAQVAANRIDHYIATEGRE